MVKTTTQFVVRTVQDARDIHYEAEADLTVVSSNGYRAEVSRLGDLLDELEYGVATETEVIQKGQEVAEIYNRQN
jgi:hypothetical protein